MLSRREFLAGALLSGSALYSSGCSAESLAGTVQISAVNLPIPELPPPFEGYRIGFLSDIHLGVTMPNETVERAVTLLNDAKIDMAVLGGDYIWIPRSYLSCSVAALLQCNFEGVSAADMVPSIFERVADLLSTIRAADGIFAVYGNHDRWEDPQRCRAEFVSRGATLLLNESRTVSRGAAQLTVVGCDDYWTGSPTLAQVPPRAKNEIRILVSHNPDYVSNLFSARRADFDVALCGHTHGGQVKLPLLGPIFCNILDRRLEEGLFEHSGRFVFTSRGIGTVELPLRVNCAPEVTVLTLRKA